MVNKNNKQIQKMNKNAKPVINNHENGKQVVNNKNAKPVAIVNNKKPVSNNNKNKVITKPVIVKKESENEDSENEDSENEDSENEDFENEDSENEDSENEDSEDDISEDEMKKMLGTSDNSDIDSEEFSEEENIQLKEAKVNRKRKLSSDDEEKSKKAKTLSNDDEGDEEAGEDNEDDEDDEDDEDYDEEADDSFINDEDEDMESEDAEDSEKVVKKKVTKKEKIDPEVLLKIKQENKEKKDLKMSQVKEIFVDAPKIDNAALKKQILDRICNRKVRTVVISNLHHSFNNDNVKTLVPERVSCVMPYSAQFHRNIGTVYVDMKTPEAAAEVAKTLNKSKQTIENRQTRKLKAIVQSRVCDDVDKYNCNRLVISNIHNKAELDEIKAILPKATRVEILPPIDRKSMKTAFAEYSTVEEAIEDYDNKHGSLIKNIPINIKFQIKNTDNINQKQSHFDKTKLFILGLKKNTRIEDFKKLFPQAINIQLTLEKGRALVSYSNEEECAVDKNNAYINKVNTKWKISYAMGKSYPKIEGETTEEKESAESKKFEGKKIEGKKFEGKKFEGKKFEGKKFEGKKFEGKKFEGKKFEGKKFEGKKSPESTVASQVEEKPNILKESKKVHKGDQQKPNVPKVVQKASKVVFGGDSKNHLKSTAVHKGNQQEPNIPKVIKNVPKVVFGCDSKNKSAIAFKVEEKKAHVPKVIENAPKTVLGPGTKTKKKPNQMKREVAMKSEPDTTPKPESDNVSIENTSKMCLEYLIRKQRKAMQRKLKKERKRQRLLEVRKLQQKNNV